MKIQSFIVLTSLCFLACDKPAPKDEKAKSVDEKTKQPTSSAKPSATSVASTVASASAKPSSDHPFEEFGTEADVLAKWQGAWVVESGSLGHYEAWEVKGKVIQAFDGKKEKTMELVIEAPCYGKAKEKSADGSSSSSAITFAFSGADLKAGLGQIGIKKGDKILACGSMKLFLWDGSKCTAWEKPSFGSGKWESDTAECKLEGTKFTGTHQGNSFKATAELEVSGDLLMNTQMKNNQVLKAKDFADAKAKLAARKK